MNLRDHLLAVRDDRGALTPAVVVDAARPKMHPLHSRFEWDNRIAGEAYRRSQASELIRSVGITYDSADGPVSVRGFLSVEREEASSEYVPTEEVMANDFTRKLLLNSMQREWKAFKRRYEHMAEFAALVTDIEKSA